MRELQRVRGDGRRRRLVIGRRRLTLPRPTAHGRLLGECRPCGWTSLVLMAAAALAYGAGDAVGACDAVVGPGNAYVTAAKSLVAGSVAIDMLAGPSEVLVIADDAADP